MGITAAVLIDAAPIVPREISNAERVLILTTLLGGFLRIFELPEKSKILPTGDFFLVEVEGVVGAGGVLGISSSLTCLASGAETVSVKGVGDGVEDRRLRPSNMVVSLFRRDGCDSSNGCSGTRNTA